MSLSRSVFNEFRPFFSLFDEIARSARPSYNVAHRHFDRTFDAFARHPVVDLSEQGDNYIVEAEIPGVKKENLDVRVGDNGRSLTIEGKIFSRSSDPQTSSTTSSENQVVSPQNDSTDGELILIKLAKASENPTTISSEREIVNSSHFARTIWLPRYVKASKISGSLEDGILRLQIPKAEEQGSVRVEIQ